MNRTYETMVLLDNREVKKGWDALKSDVCGLFEKHGAKIVSARRWDERRLAYPINGQLRGTYLLMYHDAPTESIVPINRELQYSETVLRSLTTVCEEIPEEAHQPEAEFDVNAIPEDDAPAAVEEPPAEEAKDKAKDGEGDAEAKAEEAKAEDADASAEGDAAEGEAKAESTEDSTDEETKES